MAEADDQAPAREVEMDARPPLDETATEQVEADLTELLRRNPSILKLALAAMEGACEGAERTRLAEDLASVRVPATCARSPQNVLTTLVRLGGIEQTILVDGEPYRGMPEDFARDESVTDENVVTYSLRTTPAGLRVLGRMGAGGRIARLMADKSEHARFFAGVMALCEGAGATKDQISSCLEQLGALQVNPATGQPRVYPAYFTGALEDAGAIEWDGAWRLTREGGEYLRSM